LSDSEHGQEFEPRRESPLEGWWNDLRVSAAFLTRLPVLHRAAEEEPGVDDAEGMLPETGLSLACRAFPIVGAGVGLIGAVILVLAKAIGFGPFLAGALAIAAVIAVTGGLHEDGLGDAADGFGAGRDAEARLAIMRDTRLGAYAVIAIVLSLLLRVGALAAIPGTIAAGCALVAAAAFSRAVLPAAMAALGNARTQGLAVSAGKPPQDRVIASLILGAAFVLLFLGPLGGFIALLAGGGAALAFAALAHRYIGGITGDVLGAIQQATEIAVLLAAAAMA
jgi:adenosylcobinamide-GDP ribazoletransferase